MNLLMKFLLKGWTVTQVLYLSSEIPYVEIAQTRIIGVVPAEYAGTVRLYESTL